MKSRQLANVLIKMLGLSICIYGVPSLAYGLVMAFWPAGTTKTETTMMSFASVVSAAVQVLFGVVIIAQSRTIAGWMFKDDDE